jgi:hypothetical protein
VRDLRPQVVLAFWTRHGVPGGLEEPRTALEIAKQFPTLGISLGDQRPRVRRKIRDTYLYQRRRS